MSSTIQIHRTAICLFVLLLLSGCGPSGPTWQTFHDAKAGFSVDFPGKVESPPGEFKDDGGPGRFHYFSSPGNGYGYDVSVIVQSRTPEQIERLLKDNESHPWRENDKEATFDTTRIKQGDIAGVEAVGRIDKPDHKTFKRWQTYSSPTADYYVSVESAKFSDPYHADVEKFFKSFKIDAAKP